MNPRDEDMDGALRTLIAFYRETWPREEQD